MFQIRINKTLLFSLLLFLIEFVSFAQLKNIKIILPKEIGFGYYDFIQFLPDEKSFVVCGNSLSIYTTETSEIIDEYDLNYGAKNLSVTADGKYISVTVNNELLVFSFINQKLNLIHQTNTANLIKGLPNSEYYGALPITASFFTSTPNELYVSIAGYTFKYDFVLKTVTDSHAFKLGDYIVHAAYMPKKNVAVVAMLSGSVTSIRMQPLNNLSNSTEILKNMGTPSKLKIKDSLMFCFASDKYFILNLENASVVHEVRVPKVKYESYYQFDKKYLDDINKRPALTKPDTINFAADEYIYDVDYLTQTQEAIFSTSKQITFINLKTKKVKQYKKGFLFNIKLSKAGNRLVGNGYSYTNSLRVFNPNKMKLISERPTLSNSIYSANMSPNNRWLLTNGNASAYLWDLNNFTKYAEIKDVSKSDSSVILNTFFLNDSELVVNSGKSMKALNLTIYNIFKKKFTKTIKKNVIASASGFMNNEFYYCDYTSLHIINLKTLSEEKYEGMYSLAASPQYQIISFTDKYVFVPESARFKIVNRKTKAVAFENPAWTLSSRVIINPDNTSLITTGQINTKQTINGYEVDLPMNAVVKVDLNEKKITKHFSQTYFPLDFKIKEDGKKLAVWYVKHDFNNPSDSVKKNMYTEYDMQSGEIIYDKLFTETNEIITGHHTSENGKYFALDNITGTYLKVFNNKGDLLMDLKDLKLMMPKLFYNEKTDRLIITSVVNSMATFIDLKEKKIIGQLANAKNEDYFLITSDMHYMGSKNFIKHIRFKYQSEVFSFEQFDAYLNQPHKVLRAFSCSDSNIIHSYETAYLKRMKLMGYKPNTNLNFSKLPSIQYVKMKGEGEETVNFSLSANKGIADLNSIEVFNNGSLVLSEKIPDNQKNKFDKDFVFETTSGINRFEFIIKDEVGFESARITRFYNNTKVVNSNLYLVVIGSEKFENSKFDLAYAIKDASDIANTMANSKSFNKVVVKKLFNQSFSSDSVAALKNYFSQASINDVVMIFFAGHGYLDEDFSYYFPTYYTDFNDPKINSVAFNSFEKLFKEMKPIRKLMFIDACFSGEVDEDATVPDNNSNASDTTRAISNLLTQSTALEMSKAIFSDIRQNSGATIISSAGGTEAAFEGEKWNNGLFTHCVLEGLLKSKADSNADKKITLNELQKYVSEEVFRLSDGKQSPTYRTENTVLDYELW